MVLAAVLPPPTFVLDPLWLGLPVGPIVLVAIAGVSIWIGVALRRRGPRRAVAILVALGMFVALDLAIFAATICLGLYWRLLAYVHVAELDVNQEMVRRGLAMVYTVPPNVAHAEELLAVQREARAAGRGIWRPREGLAEAPADFRQRGRRQR